MFFSAGTPLSLLWPLTQFDLYLLGGVLYGLPFLVGGGTAWLVARWCWHAGGEQPMALPGRRLWVRGALVALLLIALGGALTTERVVVRCGTGAERCD